MTRFKLLMASAALAGVVGCGTGADSAAPLGGAPAQNPTAQPGEKTGLLSFSLTAQNGATFSSFSYAITGANYAKSGSIDVTRSNTVSALIDGIPVGTGYTVTLQGTSAAPVVATCSGSATFDITAGAVTTVPVSLACHLSESDAGAGGTGGTGTPTGTPVPIPPLAPIGLGLVLCALGGAAASRRGRR